MNPTSMINQYGKTLVRYLKAGGLLPFNRYLARRLFAVAMAITPPVVFAWFADGTEHWELFERSGSITTAIGLLLASRRYIRHGVLELAMLYANDELRSDTTEVMEDVLTGKLGLALSAFGTIIWGWGSYLGWWCFMFSAVWVILALHDARRDTNANLIRG